MLQAKARWNVGKLEEEQAQALARSLELSPLLSRLLAVRGITDIEHAAEYLHGGTDRTHDPFLLDGMDLAVERIRRAIRDGERIRVYGDYDADGVSSTSLMTQLLRQLDCTFDTYIPHRIQEGYGLNKAALDAAKAQGVGLIITVDTGISAVEEVAYASELGIDIVVTDHHEPPEELPAAYALVNPKKPNCPYPFKHLAGVGVAFKLAQALLGRLPEELLEYVVIGTVADLMPLTGENRIMVKLGLERMRTTTNVGIRALLDVAGIEAKEVSSTHIGFSLAPRINASGRLLSAASAVQLLTTADEQEAEQLAGELDQLNKERQRIVDEMTKQAEAMVEELIAREGELPSVLVLAREGWNVGVIGIVASKMVDRYYRPTIVLSMDKESGMAKGSARSIAGFDLYKALSHCHDLMDHFGGHQMAAGMTLECGHLPELRKRLATLAGEWLTPEDYIPLLHADLVCAFEDINLDNIRQLEQLGPFGVGNPSPRLLFTGLALNEMRTIGKEQQHLKLSLQSGARESAAAVDAVAFGKGALAEWISPASTHVDVLGELSINEWNGIRRPQIMIQDLRVPTVQLFDWRGTSQPERKVGELLEKQKRRPAQVTTGNGPVAVVSFGVLLPEALKTFGADAALWTVDISSGFHPQNELAFKHPLSEARDIVLFTIPDTMEQIEALGAQASAVERYYAVYGDTDQDRQSGTMPSRDMFKTVYSTAVWLEKQEMPRFGYCQAIAKRAGFSTALVRFMMDVFAELGLAVPTADGYRIVPSATKKDLSASLLYRARMKRPDVERAMLYSSAKELLGKLMEYRQPKETLLEEIV